ncbi:uncharacterized protein LOC112270919 isoform X2 [Brachypodium distachyon]|uniref:uncharacterized protein LOC112270919 isoform X2 n=1 Tax=Brachypodium distachyon TaxID=15368 RepID=UPI000D0CFD1E|nr:uncharacterized protein LOC112270919 isoform X2 [Brachypodium distachyon]|eukprot:XP_024315317.1 uncharacterized protein LOC112270919 isoform X2 [Brachypodium distachyon]
MEVKQQQQQRRYCRSFLVHTLLLLLFLTIFPVLNAGLLLTGGEMSTAGRDGGGSSVCLNDQFCRRNVYRRSFLNFSLEKSLWEGETVAVLLRHRRPARTLTRLPRCRCRRTKKASPTGDRGLKLQVSCRRTVWFRFWQMKSVHGKKAISHLFFLADYCR